MKKSLFGAVLLMVALPLCAGLTGAGRVEAETVAGQDGLSGAERAAVDNLIAVMRIDQVIEVLRIEGMDYGASIEDEMFPEAGGSAWQATVARIYDPEVMTRAFSDRLASELEGKAADIDSMQAFFAAPLGQRVLQLELDARRSLLDDDTQAAAELAWADLAAQGGVRVDLLRRFAEVNDLVEANVMGALNSNLAFYEGMAGTGSFAGEMSEDQMLSDVWAQEPDIRQQTEDWVYPYLNLAYSSLSDDELQAYVDFSASAAGQVLNAALFSSFDAVFVPISRALGAAAAVQMKGQDI